MANFPCFSDVRWKSVPIAGPPVAVSVRGKCKVSVGDDDPLCPAVPRHDVVEALRLIASSYPISRQS